MDAEDDEEDEESAESEESDGGGASESGEEAPVAGYAFEQKKERPIAPPASRARVEMTTHEVAAPSNHVSMVGIHRTYSETAMALRLRCCRARRASARGSRR